MHVQRKNKLSILSIVLNCKMCDPNQQNANGDTALHIVSRMTLTCKAKLQLFLSTPGTNPQVLNYKRLTLLNVSDKDDNTLLHNACAEGESEIVQLLTETGADVLRPDRRRNTSIHIACIKINADWNPFNL